MTPRRRRWRAPGGGPARARQGFAAALAVWALASLVFLGRAGAQEQPAPAVPSPPPVAAATQAAGVRVLPTGGLRMETAALLLSGQQGGPLPLAVYATALAVAGERVPVTVVLEVDGSDLLAEQNTTPLYLEVCVYALSPDDAVQGALLQTVALDLAVLQEAIAAGGVKLVAQLALPPGEHSLRTLVRNVGTDNLGVKIVPLRVPAAGEAGPTFLAVLFDDEPASWLAVPVGDPRAMPWEPGRVPAARPLLTAGATATFRLLAANLPAEAALAVELRRPSSGEVVGELPATVTGRQASMAPGLELLTLSFTLTGVEPGELELRVGGAGDVGSPPVRVVVTEEALAGLSWAALSGAPPTHVVEAPQRPANAPRERRRLDATPIVEAYRGALQRLADGDVAAAREGLIALETRLLVNEEALTTEELREVELREVSRLAAVDPEATLPVLAVYGEIYRHHADQRATMLSTHAREMTFALASLYGGEGASPPARRLTATALLAFTAGLPANGARVVLSRALRQALVFEPGNRTALLGLAIDAERSGEYATAAQRLDDVLAAGGAEAETRLRLAVNRARLGATKRAVELLTALVDEPAAQRYPPPWWLPVAFQELARLQRAAGDGGAAERTLRRGLERLPQEEKLSLQLALLLDERGQRAQGRTLLAGLSPPRRARAYDSSRHRYNQLPLEPLRQAATDLRQSALERRPNLHAALAATGSARR